VERSIEHVAVCSLLIVGEIDGEGTRQSATQVILGEAIHPEAKRGSACTFERSQGRLTTRSQGAIDAEGVLCSVRLLEQAGDGELDCGVVGRIAGSDQELGTGFAVFAAGDEVASHLKANLAAAIVAVTLPGAIESGLVMEDGLTLVALLDGKASQLQVDGAIARRGFPEGGEVDRSFLQLACVRKRGGQLDFRCAIGHVGERRAEVLNGNARVAAVQSSLAAGLPASPEFLTVACEGAEEKQRKNKDDGGDEEERDERNGITHDEIPSCQPLFRRESHARLW
jgi:hypothetical protein